MAVMSGAEPQVFVSDFDAAMAFYTGKLGFGAVFAYGTPPYYGQVRRDAARLNLRHVDTPPIDPAARDRLELLSATLTVDDADALHAEYQAAAVPFARALGAEPWGSRSFIVRDPDGNLLYFAGPEA